MICNATMYLAQLRYDHVSNPTLPINAYEITSVWSGFNSTSPGIYSTSDPTHGSNVLDYTETNAGNTYTQISWDVTSTVKKWYNSGTNYGLFLKASDTRWRTHSWRHHIITVRIPFLQ